MIMTAWQASWLRFDHSVANENVRAQTLFFGGGVCCFHTLSELLLVADFLTYFLLNWLSAHSSQIHLTPVQTFHQCGSCLSFHSILIVVFFEFQITNSFIRECLEAIKWKVQSCLHLLVGLNHEKEAKQKLHFSFFQKFCTSLKRMEQGDKKHCKHGVSPFQGHCRQEGEKEVLLFF